MRIVFMGTPEFAVPSLRILIENNYEIVSVVTAPDKPVGRGLQLSPSAVKQFAIQNNLAVMQPEKLKDPSFVQQLVSYQPDLFVVVAFRILPKEVFSIPRYGSFNLHASLLPKYRGAAPINWAIINGEKETGVTTFFLQETVDTGNIILQARVPIGKDETAGELHNKLADIGAEIVLHSVHSIEIGKINIKTQDDSLASPAPKLFKEDCQINWQKSAHEIHNFIRGLSPKPTAFTHHNNTLLKIYRSSITTQQAGRSAGEILIADRQLIIGTGNGVLEILELQQEGKKRLTAEEFLRGYRILAGDKLI
ncbi:MAG: methionyl-tRNA formyltransferase [Bacteroidota bacterium]|nr:methionyl-tRNA formyltransferase [Bacteroidota bacterium]